MIIRSFPFQSLFVIFAWFLAVHPHTIIAQTTDTLDLDVTFVGDRELLIQDAHKILTWPEPADLGIQKPTFDYSILPKRLNIAPDMIPVGPTRLHVDPPLPRLYRGYLRAGFGRFLSPMLEASMTDLRSRKGAWGAMGTARSTKGGFVDVPTDSVAQHFSRTGIQLWGERHYRNWVLRGEANAQRDLVSYFSPIADSIASSMPFTDWGLATRVRTIRQDSTDGHFHANMRYNHFRDTATVREHLFQLDAAYTTYREDNEMSLALSIVQDQLHLRPDSNRLTFVAGVEPTVETQKGPLRVRVGAGIYVDARGAQVFHFYPKASAELVVLKGLLVPYAHLDGGVNANPYRHAFANTPWLNPVSALPADYNKFELETGLKGNITSAFHYHIRLFSRRNAQHAYWALDSAAYVSDELGGIHAVGGPPLTTRIDTLTTNGFSGTATLRFGNHFELIGDVTAYTYGLSNQSDPWGLPQLEMDFQARYALADKFNFGAGVRITDQRQGLSYVNFGNNETISGDPDNAYRFDLGRTVRFNLDVEYMYTARLSGFVRLVNITGAQYFAAPNIPVQGFQAMLGATYAF